MAGSGPGGGGGDSAPESVVRVVVTAGREASRPRSDGHPGIDAASYRIVANALAGGQVDRRALESALEAFADDPAGATRFEAMALRAWQSQVGGGAGSGGGETVSVGRAAAMIRTGAAFVRILGRRRERTERAYEQFATAAADVADAEDYQDVCQRAADALGELSGLEAAAVYVPGPENARFVRAATQSGLYELTRGGVKPASDPCARSTRPAAGEPARRSRPVRGRGGGRPAGVREPRRAARGPGDHRRWFACAR